MLPISRLAAIISQSSPGGATSFTLSGNTSGTTNSPTTYTVTPNGPLLATTTVTITAPSSTLSTSSLSFTGGSSSPQTFTVTRTTDGTTSVSITNSSGLTNLGTPISFTSTTVSAADWTTRSTGPSVVWAHNFDYDTEVTAHLLSGQTLDSAKARRVIDSSGIGCLEQITLGATLAANFTAGSTTMIINDATYWPDPAVVGTYQVVVCDPPPTVGRKNLFNVTAKSGSTLTVNLEPNASSAFVIVGGGSFVQVAQSYTIGAIVGSEASDWRRTFAALPAGENGKTTDDPGASGAVPLRSKLTGNAYSVPRDLSLWQYGWYGHPSNQTTWANWTGWQGTSSITPRGVSQGAGAKFRLWDGDEFFIQWRMKLDPRFYANHAQADPNGEDSYWGRKSWAIQSELSSLNQIVAGVATSNRYSIPSTTKTPFGLSTYKAARILGLSDNPSRITSSQQPNSPWDIAPHFANLSSSFKPSTGLATPDGSTAWEFPDNEWVTFYMRVKPGRSNVGDTEIEVKFARTEDPAYNGTYTTLLSLTDAVIVYSGSGDYDFPDGTFSYPTVTTMNALPGFQSFGIMGYLNITQSAGLPPPKASYYIRMAQVIFSKAAIPAPAVLPSWRQGQTPLTWIAVGNTPISVDPEADPAINPNYPAIAPWRNSSGGGDIYRVWNSWCSGSFSETTGRFRVHGGGHDDYAGNEIYAVDLFANSPTWILERKPTGCIGNTGVLDDLQENSGVYFDGRPRSSHTYGNLLDINGEMWLLSVAGPFRGGQGAGVKTFKFSNGDWTLIQSGNWPGGNNTSNAGSGCHDTLRNRIYYWPSGNQDITYWDVVAGIPGTVNFSTGFGRQSHAVYIPSLDIQVCLTGQVSAGFVVYDYGRTVGTQSFVPGATGTAPSYGGYDPGWFNPNGVWVPSLGAILCWHGGTGLWKLTPPASGNPATTPWVWSNLAAAPGNTLNPGNPNSTGVYSRFFYSEKLKGVGVHTQPNLPVYFFALE